MSVSDKLNWGKKKCLFLLVVAQLSVKKWSGRMLKIWNTTERPSESRYEETKWVMVRLNGSLVTTEKSTASAEGERRFSSSGEQRLVAVTDNHQLIRPIKLWHFFRAKRPDYPPPLPFLSFSTLSIISRRVGQLIFPPQDIKPIHLSFENGV